MTLAHLPSQLAGTDTRTEAAGQSTTILGLPTSVIVLTVSAVLIRLATLLLLANPANPGAMEHEGLAQSLLTGQGFAFNESGSYTEHGVFEPSSVQSPPWPLFLAGLFYVFGTGTTAAYTAAWLINVVLAAATVPMIYLLVKAFRPDDPRTHAAGLIAAGMFVVWPTQLFAVTQVQAVCFITLAVVTIAYLWLRSLETGQLKLWIAYGILGCFAALTEPVLLPAMALTGVWVLLTRRLPMGVRLRNGLILLTLALAIIGPWTWRNYRVHGVFMPIKSTFWVNVWKGNNATDPSRSGTDRPALTPERLAEVQRTGVDDLRQYDLLTDQQRIRLNGRSAAEREAIFGDMAKTWIRENPDQYAYSAGKRFVKTAGFDWDHPGGHRAFYAYPISRIVLLLGTIGGFVVAWRSGWRIGHYALIGGIALLTYTLTVTAARFAVPIEPLQFALTALLIATWFKLEQTMPRPTRVRSFLGSRGTNDGTL
jgi:hypothetical protein